MLEAWSLGFINWHLPWTNILPMEIGGEGGVAACYRNHIKLNPFKARCILIARCAFTYSVAFDVASEGCIFAVLCKDSEWKPVLLQDFESLFCIQNNTSNSWHYSCPRSVYCRSIVFLLGDRAFENAAPKVWNRLPIEIRQCQSLNIFKVLLKTHLFKLAFY